MSSFDLYQTVTDQIVAMLETGVVPWRSPILGRNSAGHPRNHNTGKGYRGVNVFLLAFTAFARGYGSSYWLTFNQARERGGNVRKGEKSSLVVFWKQYETADKVTGDPVKIPVLRYYNVFNAEQIEGIEIPDAVKFTPIEFNPIESAEAVAAKFVGGPVVNHDGGQQAFYRPSTDTVHMPLQTRFASVEEYYSTLFHELSHSTGHSSRLDRKLDTAPRAVWFSGLREGRTCRGNVRRVPLCPCRHSARCDSEPGRLSGGLVQAIEGRQEACHFRRRSGPAGCRLDSQ